MKKKLTQTVRSSKRSRLKMGLTKENIEEIINLYKDGYALYAIHRKTNISRQAITKYLKRARLRE